MSRHARPPLPMLIDDILRMRRAAPSRLKARQSARLASMITYARQNSAFYRSRWAGIREATPDLPSLPVVTKRELMASFDEWVTDPSANLRALRSFLSDRSRVGERFLGQFAVWTTSGTSGDPGIFVHDRSALAIYAALAALRGLGAWMSPSMVWTFLRAGAQSAAILAIGDHYAGAAVEKLLRSLHPWAARHITILSVLTPIPQLAQELNSVKPAILVGYPTALRLLAQEQRVGRLKLNPVLVITAAEWISPMDKSAIGAAFRCPVMETYAASEFMGIAFTCRLGRLHLNSDWVILEPVDDHDRPVPAGEESHTTLLTNLANCVQPIIRYDLGDRVTLLPERCACGSALPILRVEGRQDEIIRLAAPNGERVSLLPMALETIVEQTPGVSRYQIIQTGRRALSLRLEAASGLDLREVASKAARRLRSFLQSQGLPGIEISLRPEAPQRDAASGKFRYVWVDSRMGCEKEA